MSKGRIYIAGPMRGKPLYNAPAFNEVEWCLAHQDWEVMNPVTLDKASGFDCLSYEGNTDHEPEGFNIKECVARDIGAIISCDAMYMLEGWEDSTGAQAEHAVAEWLGLSIMYQVVPEELEAPNDGMVPDDTHLGMQTTWEDLRHWAETGNIPEHLEYLRSDTPATKSIFPTDPKLRKEYRVFGGLLNYFPNACAAVGHHSYLSNEQHNPGEDMRWARDKSIGKGDEIVRHLMEGEYVAMAWRALELLERDLTK